MVSSPLFGLILCRPGLSHGHAASEEGADKGRIASLWGKLVIAIIVPTGPFLPFLLSFPLSPSLPPFHVCISLSSPLHVPGWSLHPFLAHLGKGEEGARAKQDWVQGVAVSV